MKRCWFRSLPVAAALTLGLGPAVRAATDAATPFCPASPSVPEPSQVAPVALDVGGARRSFRYAFGADGKVVSAALVGMSHEYTCHIAREDAPVHPELA